MALEEMGSDGSLAVGHVRLGEPLSPVLQVRMGKRGCQQRGEDASPCQAAQCCAKGLRERM